MNNFLAAVALKRSTLRLVAALTVTAAITGCGSTISAISIPSNTTWRSFFTFITSQYADLTVSATGLNIVVENVSNEPIREFILCNSSVGKYTATGAGDPSTWTATYQLVQCEADSDAPTGDPSISTLGVFYSYFIGFTINDAFTTGGIAVESLAAGPLSGIALNKSTVSGSPLKIAAGVSPSVLAGTWEDDSFLLQNSLLIMGPAEPSFGNAAVCGDGTIDSGGTGCPENTGDPGLACISNFDLDADPSEIFNISTIDAIFISNRTATSYSLTCGSVPISVSVNSSYTSLGACVDANIKRECTGLKGKSRSICNNSQTGACQATFNVPSALNPNR